MTLLSAQYPQHQNKWLDFKPEPRRCQVKSSRDYLLDEVPGIVSFKTGVIRPLFGETVFPAELLLPNSPNQASFGVGWLNSIHFVA